MSFILYILQSNVQNEEQVDISNVHLAEGIIHLMILQLYKLQHQIWMGVHLESRQRITSTM
jgi:hypothetical protein